MTSRPPAPPLLRSVSLYLGTIFVLQVIRGIDSLTAWTSLEQQEALRPVLDELAVGGLSRGGAETMLRVLTIVMTGLAAMALVFLVHTARGDRASRVWLTVLTVLVATWASTGSFLDRILGFVALFCLIQLWTGPIRRYFAPEGSALAQQVAAPTPTPVPPVATTSPEAPAAPPAGWEPPPGWTPPPPHASHAPQTWAPPGWTPPTPRPKMPTTVAVAGWVGLVASGLVAGLGALTAIGLFIATSDSEAFAPYREQLDAATEGYTDADLRRDAITFGVFAALGALGGVAAVATLLRQRWGRVLLLVMSVVTIVVALASMAITSPFWGAIFAIAAVAVFALLVRPEATAWFVRTKS